ncbi:hypothetical protein L596_010180 [Steinernema carpocapsae]|uniref:Uncharacterized protein n=1 Tax=Steinernema carpocapsae TaxID=34508 RepID=A0A4U5PHK6_STECR|nr:hypothetical protein L596_010180 [Steinernema carpocapsae]
MNSLEIAQIIYHPISICVHSLLSPGTPAIVAIGPFAVPILTSSRLQNRPVRGDRKTRANANDAATVTRLLARSGNSHLEISWYTWFQSNKPNLKLEFLILCDHYLIKIINQTPKMWPKGVESARGPVSWFLLGACCGENGAIVRPVVTLEL